MIATILEVLGWWAITMVGAALFAIGAVGLHGPVDVPRRIGGDE
jgi:hypothetical protein